MRLSYATSLDVIKMRLDRFEEFCHAHEPLPDGTTPRSTCRPNSSSPAMPPAKRALLRANLDRVEVDAFDRHDIKLALDVESQKPIEGLILATFSRPRHLLRRGGRRDQSAIRGSSIPSTAP